MPNKPITDEAATLLPSDAARKLHVSTRTLIRMADSGLVAVIRLPSGHRRYLREDIDAMLPEKLRKRSAAR